LESSNADFYHNRGFSNRKLGRYAAATHGEKKAYIYKGKATENSAVMLLPPTVKILQKKNVCVYLYKKGKKAPDSHFTL
jgi:hypothetical protein